MQVFNILVLASQLSACVSSFRLFFVFSTHGILFPSSDLIILGSLCQTAACSALTRNAIDCHFIRRFSVLSNNFPNLKAELLWLLI